MRTFFYLVFFIFVGVLVTGCAYPKNLSMELKSKMTRIEKQLSKEDGGELIKLEPQNDTTFSDDNIIGDFFCGNRFISFKIKNKTENTIKLLWDEVVYIDNNKSTKKILHKGINISDSEKQMPASIIIKDGILDDFVFRADNYSWSSYSNNWIDFGSIRYNENVESKEDELKFIDFASSLSKEKFGIYLPFEIDGKKQIYTIWFENTSYEITENKN